MQRRHGTDPCVVLDKGRDRQQGNRQRRPQLPTGKTVRSVSRASVTPSTILMGTATTVSHRVLLSSSPTRGRERPAL